MDPSALQLTAVLGLIAGAFGVLSFSVRTDESARAAVVRWAATAGLTQARLSGQSRWSDRHLGPSTMGDVTYELRATNGAGGSVVALVRCNRYRRRRNIPTTIRALYYALPVDERPAPVEPRGFPLDPLPEAD